MMKSPLESLNTPDSQHQTILIVDDNPANLGVIVDYLESFGFKVLVARRGETGIEKAQFAHPDLILLDVMMPGINGFETCRRLKAIETTKAIPVIIMTALTDTEHKIEGFQAGALDYITKPFQREEVLARVQTHLNLRDLQKNLEEKHFRLQQEMAERERAEALLRKLEKAIETTEVGVTITDVAGQIEYINPADAKMHGYTVAEVMGQFSSIFAPAGEQKDTPPSEHGNDMNTFIQWKRERVNIRKDGATFPAVLISNPILDKSGQPIGKVTICEDITDLKQAEAALLDAHKTLQEQNVQLQKLNASKDKFFSIISHDLRSPFSTLLGLTEFVVTNFDKYDRDKLKQHIHILRSSAERLYALLENLLTWARLQRGAMQCEPVEFDLFGTFQENMAIFVPKADEKEITLNNEIQKNMLVYADPRMVDTVVRNLISNALKFTESGGIITISATPQEQQVEVRVTDTGRGMDEKGMAKLFRIDAHYTRVGTDGEQGTGLGLILCQELVEQNGGKIWVESEVDKGTTFRFTIPKQQL